MTVYRTDDNTKWGSGLGRNLTPTEVDVNFWDTIQRIATLEALPAASAGIDYFTVSGRQFYVVLTDTTVKGPYTLPVATLKSRGVWQALTAYSVLDTFTQNGGLYEVIFAHTSAASFSPTANDGAGNDYYSLLIQTPGSSLPTGGATGQVLQKATSSNYVVTWGWKYPTSGSARKYLIQQSSTQDDAAWGTPQALDIRFTPITGSAISASTVESAINDLESLIGTAISGLSIAATDVSFTPVTGSSLTSVTVAAALEELSVADGAFDPLTSAAAYLANTSGKALITDKVWAAADIVSLTDATTVAVDMSTFINASFTIGGNRTLGNPTNTKGGQSGVIKIVQDGTGSRTLTLDTFYKTAAGAGINLSTAPAAVDLLFYQVFASNFIYVTLIQDVK